MGSVSIIDRLDARLAAAPALTDVGTLFGDLADAKAAILAAEALAVHPETESPTSPSTDADDLAHVHTLLTDAKERLAVNALGDVARFIDSAIKLLEG